MTPVTLLRTIDRVVARWERGAAVALLAVTVVIVVLQVFFRYVLNSSLSWSEEAARYLFIWAALLGFSSCVEARRQPYDFQETPPSPATAATMFVPFFWPDEPDSADGFPGYPNDYLDDATNASSWKTREQNPANYSNP